eukprot:scaffold97604_cov22-Tisochrysis_lutea.AAC.3
MPSLLPGVEPSKVNTGVDERMLYWKTGVEQSMKSLLPGVETSKVSAAQCAMRCAWRCLNKGVEPSKASTGIH